MWWEPQNDEERFVSATVRRLTDYFLSPNRTLPFVYGVGSTLDDDNRRVPLLVLNLSLAPPRAPDWRERLLKRNRAFRRFPPFPLTSARRQRDRLFLELRDAGREVQEGLAPWEVPERTRVLFSRPPIPLEAKPGSQIWAEDRDATLGFQLKVGDRMVFSTAGHLVKTAPCAISVRYPSRFAKTRVERIGMVRFRSDPTPSHSVGLAGGVDIAILEPSAGITINSHLPAQLADPATMPNNPSAILFGGKSHKQRGWINGALPATRSEDGREGRVWKNCWVFMEIDGGCAQPGDSGGPVMIHSRRKDSESEALGHVVCALGVVRSTGRFQCGLVQDIHTTIDFLASHYREPVSVIRS